MDWLTVTALKYKRLAASHGSRLVILLVLFGLLVTGVGGAQFLSPPMEEQTDREHRQQIRTSAHTQAVVTEETILYEQDTVLDDKSLYLTDAAPELTVTMEAMVPDDQPVETSHRLAVVYSAANRDEVFWTRTDVLAADTQTVSDGTATTSVTISIPDVLEEVEQIEGEIGSAGTVNVRLTHTLTYETDRYDGELTGTAPLDLSRNSYAVGDGLDQRTTHTSPVTTERPAPDAVYTSSLAGTELVIPKRSIVLAAVGLALLIAGAYTALLLRRGIDAETVERRLDRRRFSEWISEGRLPNNLGTRQVSVASLVDLVDIGIDTNRRVVYDPDRDRYAVIDDEVVYYYDIEASASEFEFADM